MDESENPDKPRKSLYSDTEDLFRKAGIDRIKFDEESPKTFFQLVDERILRDVRLVYSPSEHRLIRVAISAAVLVRFPSHRVQLVETGRFFRRTRKTVMKRKRWTLTETCKTNEDIGGAAVRGVYQELNRHVSLKDLVLMDGKDCQEYFRYESTAYKGLWTYSMVQKFVLDLLEAPWDEVPVIYDSDTINYLEFERY